MIKEQQEKEKKKKESKKSKDGYQAFVLHMLGLVESFTDYLQSTEEMENETKIESPKKEKESKIYN